MSNRHARTGEKLSLRGVWLVYPISCCLWCSLRGSKVYLFVDDIVLILFFVRSVGLYRVGYRRIVVAFQMRSK